MARAGGSGAGGASPAARLLSRIGLYGFAPVLAAYLQVTATQVSFIAGSAVFWSILEVGIIYKVRAMSFCRNLPFVMRLICSYGLDLQGAWLFAPDSGPALHPGFDSLFDNVSSAIVASGGPAAPAVVNTLSVVLPCANEGEFVLKTVRAVFEATPSAELKEIIVIDDASNPPVSTHLKASDLEAYRTRVIRHRAQEGLIRSKKDGGDAAQGDVIVFLDCHVKPMGGWTGPILSNLRENPKRVVVPSITSLDPDTWEEISRYGGGTKMCLTWNADFFWCNEYPGPYVPIMSGGLLAMTKYWWETIGGYDSEMKAWGGENLDQSLRTWLCGGEIRVAQGSRVAHMWRDPNNPKTMLRYRIPTNDVRRNRLRAAKAWFDGWADKVLTFPEFEDFREGGPLSTGSLDNIEYYRKKLKCKSFDWYLNRFKDFYVDTGRIPSRVYNLRERQSGLCLNLQMKAGKPGGYSLRPCSRDSDMQRFHEANSGDSKRCCSGLKAWDFDSCLAAYSMNGEVSTTSCDFFGRVPAQHVVLTSAGLLEWHNGRGCIVAKQPPSQQPTQSPGSGLVAVLLKDQCNIRMEWTTRRNTSAADLESSFRIVMDALCLTAAGAGETLAFAECREPAQKEQVFSRIPAVDGSHYQLKGGNGLCLEVEPHNVLKMQQCKPREAKDTSQRLFQELPAAPVIWADTVPLYLCTASAAPQVVNFAPCASGEEHKAKPGQGFAKDDEHTDGSFRLRDADLRICLRPQNGEREPKLVSAPCGNTTENDDAWRWTYKDKGGQLRNVGLNLCIDANDMVTPIIYPCYPPGQNVKQRYLLRESGWVEIPRSWADNGRLRYPAQCLDSRPVQPINLTVTDCGSAGRKGLSWERLWEEEPLEGRLWRQAAAKRGFLAA